MSSRFRYNKFDFFYQVCWMEKNMLSEHDSTYVFHLIFFFCIFTILNLFEIFSKSTIAIPCILHSNRVLVKSQTILHILCCGYQKSIHFISHFCFNFHLNIKKRLMGPFHRTNVHYSQYIVLIVQVGIFCFDRTIAEWT